MLDPDTTVMDIWPAPMIYAGPTEVQFHASSRRHAGASFFVVGRDAAGMKGSMEAVAHMDDDIYKGEHARYVLQMSPVLEDGQMGPFPMLDQLSETQEEGGVRFNRIKFATVPIDLPTQL